ncbi:MAG TPA: 2'-5' RNA ligase family protein [Chitinophagaceae bacterium]
MKSVAKMYFIGIAAQADVNEQVLQWKHYMRDHYGCTVALRSPAHITLIPPFWMEEVLENELIKDVGIFASRRSSLEISLQNFDAFKPKVIFVAIQENEDLTSLKLSLEDFLVSLNKYPVKKETRPFHPHLTIANRDLRKKDFGTAFEHFSKINYQAGFLTDKLDLFMHNGSIWTIAHSWPLGLYNEK